jgi:hypothetical protein
VPDPLSGRCEIGDEEEHRPTQIPRDSDSGREECSDFECHKLTHHKDSSHLPDLEHSSEESDDALSNDLYAELEPDSDLDRQQRDEEYEGSQDSGVKKEPGKGNSSLSKKEWFVQKRWKCAETPLEEINSQLKHIVTSLYKASETEAPIGN